MAQQPQKADNIKYAIIVGPNRAKGEKHISPALYTMIEDSITHFKENIPPGMKVTYIEGYAPNGPVENFEIVVAGTTPQIVKEEMETLLHAFHKSLSLTSYVHDISSKKDADVDAGAKDEFVAEDLGLEVTVSEYTPRHEPPPPPKPGRRGGGGKGKGGPTR